jgi:N-carbamoyl-L-amino-acid hydrolase
MTLTLEQLNQLDPAAFVQALDGLYEHSPWVVQTAAQGRPYASWPALKLALARAVRGAGRERQLALIQAHPDLAGKAALSAPASLSRDSRTEQTRAGLTQCSPEELARLQALNAAYRSRFGHPFILAVGGPDGHGLPLEQILAAFERRLEQPLEAEFAECLRQIDRIAELRLNARAQLHLPLGQQVMQWADALAVHSDSPGQLTVAYLTPAHRAVSAQLALWMKESGFDRVEADAVGNLIGRYEGTDPKGPTVLTGSHFDTVRNGGRYDGRLGILLPMALVRHLHGSGQRLPCALEVIGFAEEEGVRFKTSFLGSQAMTGRFDPAWLDLCDADGTTMRQAMRHAGLDPAAAAAVGQARTPAASAFVEVHIEQGPVLLEADLPVGVVTSIAGAVRLQVQLTGMAGHAGTTPMGMRRDAAAAAAEAVLLVESRCQAPGVVGTVGMLNVPDGSSNVIPGACHFSIDIRSEDDALRDAAVHDVSAGIAALCARRGIRHRLQEVARIPAVRCDAGLVARWSRAIEHAGLPVRLLPSGAGHDAMKMAARLPVAMLFTRCGNGGVSHTPLETMTADDAELAGRLLLDFLHTSSGDEHGR